MASKLVLNRVRRAFSSSALYVTGDKAHNTFVPLTPYINFEEQLQHKNELIDNIKARKLAIDLDKIEKRWHFYQMINDHKTVLEVTRDKISEMIRELKKEPEQNQADIEALILHSKQVRDDLRNVKEFSYGIEENAALGVLNLPNVLHPKTPNEELELVHEYLEKPNHASESHLKVGENLIEYLSPMLYYLKSDAALFEFSLSNYFHNFMLNLNYTQFSNANFARSIVIDGCGSDFSDSSKVFTLATPHNDKVHEISKLHLVGGASLYSFMAYFTKHLTQPTVFPLKLFSIGKIYQPVNKKAKEDLLNVSQSSIGSVFIATLEDDSEMLETIEKLLINLYEPLGYHFRLAYVPANQLENSESLRLSVQMFSNHLQEYVEVGNVSSFDDYLSKRLLFTYTEKKQKKFPKVIAGNVVNVQKILSCALENNASTDMSLLPDTLKKHL